MFDWTHFPVESSSPNAISGISKFCGSQKTVLAQKQKPVIARCQVHLTLMRGKVSNREITIIVKFVLVVWIPSSSKDKGGREKMGENKKDNSFSWQNKRAKKTNPTWILHGKLHYFSSQRKESMGRSSITGQNADPSKRGCFIPVCGSPRPSTEEEKLSFPTEAISMGYIFQIKCCPCSSPSYTSVNPQ